MVGNIRRKSSGTSAFCDSIALEGVSRSDRDTSIVVDEEKGDRRMMFLMSCLIDDVVCFLSLCCCAFPLSHSVKRIFKFQNGLILFVTPFWSIGV